VIGYTVRERYLRGDEAETREERERYAEYDAAGRRQVPAKVTPKPAPRSMRERS
jgi:hypothetical protein